MTLNTQETLMFNHPYSPNLNVKEAWGNPVEEYDETFLGEVCDFFAAKEDPFNGTVGSSTWTPLVSRHESIIKDMRERNLPALHESLLWLCKSPLADGTCGGDQLEGYYKSNDHQRNLFVFGIFDKLVSIAEAADVVKGFNPEDPTFQPIMEKYPEEILRLIETRYQFDISAPKFAGGNLGMDAGQYGIYSQRDMFGLYLALQVADKFRNKDISICDIGGGVGHLVYYLYRLGYRNLTIVDLPTISVSQKYFLGTNLPKDNGIKLLSQHEFDGDYDLVINSDSFIEMGRETAKWYLDTIQDNAGYLISVNQETGPDQFEDGFRVCDITDMRRVARFRSWVRPGWIHEEYLPS